MKTIFNNDFLLAPCPTVLVTSSYNGEENVFTVSWTGIASSHPECVTIAINQKRFSHFLIQKSKKFCINIPNCDIIDKVDYCGSCSGKDVDKFSNCHFTKHNISDFILIDECPVSILCEVFSMINLGSHDLFVSKVVKKYVEEGLDNNLRQNLDPIAYFRPYYYPLGKKSIGYYGYTQGKLFVSDNEK